MIRRVSDRPTCTLPIKLCTLPVHTGKPEQIGKPVVSNSRIPAGLALSIINLAQQPECGGGVKFGPQNICATSEVYLTV